MSTRGFWDEVIFLRGFPFQPQAGLSDVPDWEFLRMRIDDMKNRGEHDKN